MSPNDKGNGIDGSGSRQSRAGDGGASGIGGGERYRSHRRAGASVAGRTEMSTTPGVPPVGGHIEEGRRRADFFIHRGTSCSGRRAASQLWPTSRSGTAAWTSWFQPRHPEQPRPSITDMTLQDLVRQNAHRNPYARSFGQEIACLQTAQDGHGRICAGPPDVVELGGRRGGAGLSADSASKGRRPVCPPPRSRRTARWSATASRSNSVHPGIIDLPIGRFREWKPAGGNSMR